MNHEQDRWAWGNLRGPMQMRVATNMLGIKTVRHLVVSNKSSVSPSLDTDRGAWAPARTLLTPPWWRRWRRLDDRHRWPARSTHFQRRDVLVLAIVLFVVHLARARLQVGEVHLGWCALSRHARARVRLVGFGRVTKSAATPTFIASRTASERAGGM